jgi:uncharacterized protein (DUF1501 family)
MTSRRNFLKISSLASASLLMPQFLQGMINPVLGSTGRKLIIIQLSGGNDGLNTVVPYEDDHYYRARGGIGIAPQKIIRLNDYLGLNPEMEAIRHLYDDGQMTILNSVGYPNPNRSHFRAMDIWHTGSNAHEYWDSGWLGRYLDHQCSGCEAPHRIIEVDDTLSLAVKGEKTKGLAVQNPRQLYQATQDPYLKSLEQHATAPPSLPDSELDYLYKTLTETIHSAEYIYEKSNVYRSKITYPSNPLGKRLKMVAELINSGVETSVFYLSLPGFDTHVRQRSIQDRLLRQYSEAISAFQEDLEQNQQWDNTMIMTFSEFGRRVEQNASGGTDHGKANNLFLLGGKLKKPGVFNAPPNLARLDDGDLQWEIDFRQVYATLLEDWMEVSDDSVLKRKFKKLRLIEV